MVARWKVKSSMGFFMARSWSGGRLTSSSSQVMYDDVGHVVVVDDDDDDGYYMCHKNHFTPGRYKDGYPEGPAWIFSPTDSEGTEEGALYVHFKNGQLVTDSVVVVLPGWEKAIAGRY